MPVVKAELNGIVPHLRSRLGSRFGLKYRQNRGSDGRSAEGNGDFFFAAFVVAGRAGAIVAKKWKIKVALVAVGPGDVHACACFHVDFDGGWFSALIDGYWHLDVSIAILQLGECFGKCA